MKILEDLTIKLEGGSFGVHEVTRECIFETLSRDLSNAGWKFYADSIGIKIKATVVNEDGSKELIEL